MAASLAESAIADRARDLAAALADGCRDRETCEARSAELLARLGAEDPAVRAAASASLREDGGFELLATAFQQALRSDPFDQTESFEHGVSTRTSVRLEGQDPRRVLEAMTEMPWSAWWRHGRVVRWRHTEPGADFCLWPVWPRVPIRVRITIEDVLEADEEACGLVRTKLVMPARFAGCFEGPAHFEIVTLPDGALLRAEWRGIFPRGWVRLLSFERMARNHLAAERGEMPGAPGGGYLGLRRFLEERRAL